MYSKSRPNELLVVCLFTARRNTDFFFACVFIDTREGIRKIYNTKIIRQVVENCRSIKTRISGSKNHPKSEIVKIDVKKE